MNPTTTPSQIDSDNTTKKVGAVSSNYREHTAPEQSDTAVVPGARTMSDPAATGGSVSVWTTAQAPAAVQRAGRYVSGSVAHPAKMLPAIAAHAIAHYTQPGELVLDPMCGIGTTLVEAVQAGRHALGVEYEPRWAALARANLDHAAHTADPGAPARGSGEVYQGDARHLEALLPASYERQVALVMTSPPYGRSTHGQLTAQPGNGIRKFDHRYSHRSDRGNLATEAHHRLLAGFTRILAGLTRYLRPGGHIVITARPWRKHRELVDLPSQLLACARRAGLIPVERCVALLARADGNTLVARPSFYQLDYIRKQRQAGLPMHLIAHEDLLVARLSNVPSPDARGG